MVQLHYDLELPGSLHTLFFNNVTNICTKYFLNNYTNKVFKILRDFEALKKGLVSRKNQKLAMTSIFKTVVSI